MIEFSLEQFALTLMTLEANYGQLQNADPHARVPPEFSTGMATNLRKAVADFVCLGTPRACAAADLLARDLGNPDIPWNTLAIKERLRAFISELLHELAQHKWVRIDARHAVYLRSHSRPFGDNVYAAFEGARRDIHEAVSALAVELNTAAVFHSMRVAEQGLKWLAQKMRIKLTDKKKPISVTEATWAKIIDGVRVRIGEARTLPMSPTKRNRLEQYARAADQCDYMREIWRNNVSHAHKSYDALEASTALSRVRDFMQFLADIK